MLDNLLHKLKLRDCESTEKANPTSERIQDLPFSSLRIFRQLESTTVSNFRCTFRGQKSSSFWQFPLPFDVLFIIINTHLINDQSTLVNLCQTCRSLAEVCRPILYHTVTIRSRSGDVVTASEKLAFSLSKSPDIVDHIRTLRILDHGRMFEGSRPITPEEESLCYILTRRYPKLKRLELSLHVVWTLLPTQVQRAFEEAFSIPTLQEVGFEHIQIPVDLFRFFQDLRVLEMRGEASLPKPKGAWSTDNSPETYCLPERILLKDDSRSGFITLNLFHQHSALRFSKLKHLQLYVSGEGIKLLQVRLDTCSTTLTTLELYIGTWGCLPGTLDLASLKALTSLLLTSDISMIPYGGMGTEGPYRFNWLIATLSTCYRPSHLEHIKFVIRTRSFQFARRLPWADLDNLFSPTVETSWPSLRVFDVLHVTEYKDDYRGYVEGSIEGIVIPMMPIVKASNVLKFGVTDQWMEFWRV